MKSNERYTGKAAGCAAFLLFLLGCAGVASASVAISPVLIELSEQGTKEVVRVTNTSDAAKSFEVKTVAWSQSEKEREIYAETDELLAVPPLFTLQPGETQNVRVGLMRRASETMELAYRVFFTELDPPEIEEQATTGVSMRLRFGVPVFVAPLSPVSAGVEFLGIDMVDGHTFMQLKNTGNVHVKVNEIRYLAPLATEKEVTTAVFYLHAGNTGFLPVELPGESASGTVELVTDTAGVLEYVLSRPE
jgi:fimbrial chaperone protein